MVFNLVQTQPHILAAQFHHQYSELIQQKYEKQKTTQPKPSNLYIHSNPHPRPSPNKITISVDGAIREPIGGVIGFVVRECNDSILFSGGRSFANILDPFVIEALALREAIIWGIE